MRYSLTSLIGYLTLACVAVALTQQKPLVGCGLFVVTLFLVGMVVSAETWERFFACVIISMSVFCMASGILIEAAWPNPYSGIKGVDVVRESWRGQQFGLIRSMMIPFACFFGTLWAGWLSRRTALEGHNSNWYLREAIIMVIAGCSVVLFFFFYPAIGLEKVLRHGNQFMFVWQHQEPFSYPTNPDAWLAMEWNEKYFSVSLPLMLAGLILSAGSIIFALKFVRPKLRSWLLKT